jgi:hypothetical protein
MAPASAEFFGAVSQYPAFTEDSPGVSKCIFDKLAPFATDKEYKLSKEHLTIGKMQIIYPV